METISHDIRYKAAAAVFALGTRCESKGRAPDMPPKNGWVKSGAGSLYIWPEKLREAIAYFDIAISILPEASWTYAKALLLEQLSDFAAAEQAFLDLSGGHYAHPGAKGAQRCAQKRLGTYNAKSTFATAFAEMTEGLAGAKGKNPGLAEAMQYVQSLADSFLGGSAAAPAADSAAPGPTVVTTAEVPVDTDDDDPAVVAAVHFVDRLLLQRYDEAHALLHSSLAATVSAAELQIHFEALFTDEVFPESANAMEPLLDWPDKHPDDLASVYVAIDSENAEAVSVIVSREGARLTIREIEWGRP